MANASWVRRFPTRFPHSFSTLSSSDFSSEMTRTNDLRLDSVELMVRSATGNQTAGLWRFHKTLSYGDYPLSFTACVHSVINKAEDPSP